jgi:hypothetical protein
LPHAHIYNYSKVPQVDDILDAEVQDSADFRAAMFDADGLVEALDSDLNDMHKCRASEEARYIISV